MDVDTQINIDRPAWVDDDFARWLHSHPLKHAEARRVDAYIVIDDEMLDEGIWFVQDCAKHVLGLTLERRTALEICSLCLAYQHIDSIDFEETLAEALKAYVRMRAKGAQA